VVAQRHLARFVVEVIDGLDLSELVKTYRGSGLASYHPAMLQGLLVYGYATKTFSARSIECATHDSVAFRFIAGNEHPDHDTIATFRERFLSQIASLFVEVLKLAHDLGMLKLGTVALDGTKVHANASRHNALEAALCPRYEIPARLGPGAGEDGASIAHASRERTVRAAQAHSRTGVWHHQIGDGLSAMPAARAQKRQGRVEFGDDELEHQANVRDADLLSEPRNHSADNCASTS
jgi:transposase